MKILHRWIWILISPIVLGTFPVNAENADYVIVGVGTSGGLLAKRLTDDNKTSVIALHSGKNFVESFIVKYSKNTPFSVLATLLGVPLPFDINALNLPPNIVKMLQGILQLQGESKNLLYETGVTVPQVNADNRNILWVIATPFGGASSINAGAWARETDQVNAQWEEIAGPQWSVNRISSIYKDLERYSGKTTNPKSRGTHGPLHVLQDKPISVLAQKFTTATIEATGFPFVLDYNNPKTPIGVSAQMQLTHRGDEGFYRVSSATAFLGEDVMNSDGKGVHGRKLKVHFNSTALRTIWDGNRAIGVEYMQDGVTKQVFANKGVIVCAGLRSSPFLLQSGIGPSSLLNSLNIPVVFDNPNVGQGLADQPQVPTLFLTDPNDSFAGSNRTFSQIAWLPAPGGDPNVRQVRLATTDIIPGLTIMLVDLPQPLSRGTVSINSADPLAPPVIDLGILSNPSDLNLYIAAFQTYVKAVNIQLQQIDPQYRLIFPPPEILDDTAALTAFIQDSIASNMTFQSHCRMAPLNQGGVVDSNGRVYGTVGLYIADNSIVPQCMDGTPMATGYLIAENIARLLGY